MFFNALSGGHVNLAGLTQSSAGQVIFKSDGAGSQLNLSALTGLAGTSYADGIQATNGGTLNDPLLTTLSDATLTLDGTSTTTTSQLTSIVNGTINLSGGTPSFNNVTDINGTSLNVTGGTLSLPLVTSFNNDGELVTG